MASSGYLIKDTKLLNQWRHFARDLALVEMELSGVYIAAQRRDREYPILAVRGISDIVGFRRDPRWTTYACSSAASFFCRLLRNMPADFLERFHGLDTKPIDDADATVKDAIAVAVSDTHTLEILFDRTNVSVDRRSLLVSLADFKTGTRDKIRVRLDTSELSQKLIHIAEKMASEAERPFDDEVLVRLRLLPTVLPLFWGNLSELSDELISRVFSHFGRNIPTVEMAMESTARTIEYGQYLIGRYLFWTNMHYWAHRIGMPDVADYLEKYSPHDESSKAHYDPQLAVRDMQGAAGRRDVPS